MVRVLRRFVSLVVDPPADLTVGSIPRNLLALAIPVALTQMFTVVFQTVDYIFLGHMADHREAMAAQAAVIMSGQIIFFVSTFLLGFVSGTSALVARAIGEKDPDKAADAVFQSLLLCVASCVVLAAVGFLFGRPILELMGARGWVLTQGVTYLQIELGASLVVYVLFLVMSILQGSGDGITPMWLLGIANLINIAVDPLLIYGLWIFPRLGVAGAAWSTVIGRAVGCVIGLSVLVRGRSRIHLRPHHVRVSWRVMWQAIAIGIPASLQFITRSAAGLLVIALFLSRTAEAIRDATIAGFGIGSRVLMLAMMPGFGVGRASGALAGQNLGAGKPRRSMQTIWVSVVLYSAFMLVAGIVSLLCPRFLAGLFTPNEEVIDAGAEFLSILGYGYVFMGISVVVTKSLEGAGYTMVPMLATVAVQVGLMLPLCYLMFDVFGLQPSGIWYATVVANVVSALVMVAILMRGAWQKVWPVTAEIPVTAMPVRVDEQAG